MYNKHYRSTDEDDGAGKQVSQSAQIYLSHISTMRTKLVKKTVRSLQSNLEALMTVLVIEKEKLNDDIKNHVYRGKSNLSL